MCFLEDMSAEDQAKYYKSMEPVVVELNPKAMKHLYTDEDIVSTIAQTTGKIVVVKFGAVWCGPCVALAPKLEKLAKEYTGNPNVLIASVDVDECKTAS